MLAAEPAFFRYGGDGLFRFLPEQSLGSLDSEIIQVFREADAHFFVELSAQVRAIDMDLVRKG